MSELCAVLWDMDGTLVDSEKIWDVVFHETTEWLGGKLSGSQRSQLVGAHLHTVAVTLLEAAGRESPPEAIAATTEEIRRRAVDRLENELAWRPGAREALSAVHTAGIRSALVTSTERALTEIALNTIGRGFFDVTVCGDEVEGLHKPHPRPYLKAAELLGVTPDRCVAIEDSPPGAAAGVAAGCTVLVIQNDVAVEPGKRRVFRDSLIGVDVLALATLLDEFEPATVRA